MAFAAGCGHATVPCPTPTADLDRHREESMEAQREVGRAVAEERALKERRDQTRSRLEAAQAAADSMARAGGR
ncbi:MAG TPA: hypothetical protein VF363_10320 [Candidatus Eisenbacteria bacterium]